MVNWYKRQVKIASIRYMYHGTSINNLSSILSEGLNMSHGSIYDETFQNERGTRNLESYFGTYFTDNLRTALMAGFTAAEKNKVKTATSVLVIVQLEDKTPSIVIDEDLLATPYWAVYRAAGNIDAPIVLAEWIKNDFPNIEEGIEKFLQDLSNGRTQITDPQFLNGLRPYIPDLLKTFAIKQLAIAINQRDFGSSTVINNYPEFQNIDLNNAVQDYRNAESLFIQKAHRLTSYMKSDFQNNMRITEPISYRGKNKIILVSTFERKSKRDEDYDDYDYIINIYYMSNRNILDQYINDIKTKYGEKFLIKYQNNIIYNSKEQYELV